MRRDTMIQFLGDRMKIKIDFQSGIPLYEQKVRKSKVKCAEIQ